MVTIAVHGEAIREVEPEIASARLAVETRSDERAVAVQACVAAQRALLAELESLVADGSVTKWTSSRVSTRLDWVQRQFDAKADAEQVAQASVRAEFRDLAVLGDWIARVAEDEAIRVEGIEWDVTTGTRIRVERELRVEAVADALRRARDYADALEAGEIEVERLQEPGLRTGTAEPRLISGLSARAASAGGFQFRAEPLELSARIELDLRTK